MAETRVLRCRSRYNSGPMTFELTQESLTIGALVLRWYSVMILSGLLAGIAGLGKALGWW